MSARKRLGYSQAESASIALMRVLLAAHLTVGHTQALRAVGRQLLQRGHQVRFATTEPPRLPRFLPVPPPLRSAAELVGGLTADGFALVPLRASLAMGWAALKVASSRGFEELRWALRLFTCDMAGVARALSDELTRRPADLVVADCYHYGSWLAAERLGLPFVAVFHSGLPFPAPGEPPLGSPLEAGTDPQALAANHRRGEQLSRTMDATVGAARRALGLPEIAPGLVLRPYARGLNVLTTFEQFELPRPDLAAQADGPLLWAGPCLGESRPAVPFPWERLGGPRPWVYVSLGTVFNDQPQLYRTLLAGVHAAGARAVVAAGASFEALSAAASPDDVVVKFAPQVELLPRMQAVIGHGGNNSTNETLRAGKPLLVVPFGGEQLANARRCVALGVARALAGQVLDAAAVASALRALLSPEAAARSLALARAVPKEDGVPRVVTALEALGGGPEARALGPAD